MPAPLPVFHAPYAADDAGLARLFLERGALPAEREAKVDALARANNS